MWILYAIFLAVIFVLLIGLYNKSTNAICTSKKRLDGKTVLVTGGTSGIGLRTATDFADRGARVIIACPFEREGKEALKYIIKETENKEVIFKLLDLSSFDSVRKFAKEVLDQEKRLDILMNNAGIGAVGKFVTKDGMSFITQVNYFGPFLLTLLLLPLLKKSGNKFEPARIINTSSYMHYLGTVNFDKINDTEFWRPVQLYSNSKLYLVLFAHELTKRMKGLNVVVNCVEPGTVATRIFYSYGKILGTIIIIAVFLFFKTPWVGAQTGIHAALGKKAGTVSGQMFRNCNLVRAKKAAYDDKTAERLWKESIKLVGLSNVDLDKCFKGNI